MAQGVSSGDDGLSYQNHILAWKTATLVKSIGFPMKSQYAAKLFQEFAFEILGMANSMRELFGRNHVWSGSFMLEHES